MEHDSSAEGFEGPVRLVRRVDAVIVHDEVHAASTAVAASEEPEQLTEERSVHVAKLGSASSYTYVTGAAYGSARTSDRDTLARDYYLVHRRRDGINDRRYVFRHHGSRRRDQGQHRATPRT